jgi:hypothetical protein
MTRRRLFTGIVVMLRWRLATLATPIGRAVALASMVRVAEVSTKVLRLPCWIVDHSKCFSLDRLDPTCPHNCKRSTAPKEALCRFNSRNIASGSSWGPLSF